MKSALLTFYAALPQGCLQLGSTRTAQDLVSSSLAEADGWNAVLDASFRDYVAAATTPTAVMEVLPALFYPRRT